MSGTERDPGGSGVPRRDEAPGAAAALEDALRARTPARILVGAAGPAYRTTTQLALRRDHAAAVDAVRAEIDLHADLGTDVVERWELFAVRTCCRDKEEYLMRPDLGQRFDEAERVRIARECPPGADLQVVIGDGLSPAAVAAHAPGLLEPLAAAAAERGWTFGRPFLVRYCRVGILNEIGTLLDPEVVVLLIRERPGLRSARSLSAYLAFRPRATHTDADRNLVCGIQPDGVAPADAVRRIVALAERMRAAGRSGVTVKEELPPSRPLVRDGGAP